MIYALAEESMRHLSKLALASLMIIAAVPAFAQSSSIQIEKPWARATPAGAKTGAAYMTIDNKSSIADRLTGASSEVAKTLQIHEMKVVNGIMKMREIRGGLRVPGGHSVTLKPGGYHVMLIGLNKPLKAGEKFSLTLVFEKAGKVSFEVPVEAMGATHGGIPGMGHMDVK
jgi:periplasmic copper chaperone A